MWLQMSKGRLIFEYAHIGLRSQMGWGGITSNEKVVNWLSSPANLAAIFCELLSVQHTEIKWVRRAWREGESVHLIISPCLRRASPSVQITRSLDRHKRLLKHTYCAIVFKRGRLFIFQHDSVPFHCAWSHPLVLDVDAFSSVLSEIMWQAQF